ncbi:MAG TPA: ROK family protein [Acidimicrobiales bacterium]|nr:ROK family protein [Acidimicrobiales bacterium]
MTGDHDAEARVGVEGAPGGAGLAEGWPPEGAGLPGAEGAPLHEADEDLGESGSGQLVAAPQRPFTLAIDIGGTGLKASVLDAAGAMVAQRVKVATTYPMPPTGEGGMVEKLRRLVAPLPAADRVSAGFPGMVRQGRVLSAPHFVTRKGPGSAVDPELVSAWSGFDLAGALAAELGKPTRVANDADVQGLAVVAGRGLEFVITLGTGFGTAVFMDGRLLPHLELAHQPFRKGQSYNEQLGEAARKEIGDSRWNSRVRKAIAQLDALLFFDHLYIGGGNARKVDRDDLGEVLRKTTVVDNTAGILGGIKLWEGVHLGV